MTKLLAAVREYFFGKPKETPVLFDVVVRPTWTAGPLTPVKRKRKAVKRRKAAAKK